MLRRRARPSRTRSPSPSRHDSLPLTHAAHALTWPGLVALATAAPLAAAQGLTCPAPPASTFTWAQPPVAETGAWTPCKTVQDSSWTTGNGGTGMPATLTMSTTASSGTASGGLLALSAGGTAGSILAYNSWDKVTHPDRPRWSVSTGNGGVAQDVQLSVAGNVTATGAPASLTGTSPASSIGLVAASIGGAGGSVQVQGNYDPQDFLGTVGTGGAGGNVAVNLVGNLTVGNGSPTAASVLGILAQSLGGGGGVATLYGHDIPDFESKIANGGNAGNVTVTVQTGSAITLQGGSVQQGIVAQSVGAGAATTPGAPVKSTGSVGDGGEVTVVNHASITTGGASGFGILAQSIGGGGGVVNLDPNSTTYAVANAKGLGSSVAVMHAGGATLTTTGADAAGIVAQALGDGGGILSTCNPETGVCAPGTPTSAQITIGSQDNKGFAAGAVQVALGCNAGQSQAPGGAFAGCTASGGTIVTQGDAAMGILAQSVASGGGNGVGNALFSHVGSDGKSGGNGAEVDVTVTSASRIATQGDGAFAILAQSVGGGGGNGGTARAWAAAVGGSGGMGGNGGTVNVTLGGSGDTGMALQTTGDFASGVVAQSVGGGGGNGGYAKAISFFFDTSIGGRGGSGGAGGAVTVANYGAISTAGAQSNGILAQSVGGGGGVGGAALSYTASNFFGYSMAVGGDAGSGAWAEAVTVNHGAGAIVTTGADAIGILAQSVGGGGGTGGGALAHSKVFSIVPTEGAPDPITFSVALGGRGGGGGDGDNATVRIGAGASIATRGDGALGLLVQSIGGGGGQGGDSSITSSIGTPLLGGPTNPEEFIKAVVSDSFGFGASGDGGNGGVGASVAVTMDAAAGGITTAGNGASALVAQSVGGGGGNGSAGNTAQDAKIQWKIVTIPWKMGGSVGGDGGEVDVVYAGQIGTTGSDARGIVAQSIGSGGGLLPGGAVASDGGTDSKVTQTIALGGSGAHGNGGVVNVQPSRSTAHVTTAGGYSDGILAQSIGGGGGMAGNADANVKVSGDMVLGYTAPMTPPGADTPSNFVMLLKLGGSGGAGGAVSVGNAAGASQLTIDTVGAWSQGILAQSIGGGGGVAGAAALAGETGTYAQDVEFGGTAGGAGGSVGVQGIGAITTQGYGASAIVAQSIGGGGGFAVDGTGATIARTLDLNTNQFARGGGMSGSVTVAVGGGHLKTTGDLGYGVLAQSIAAGGGGAFGFGDGGTTGITATMHAQIGSWGDGSGSGSNTSGAVAVSVDSGGGITTAGVQSHAIVAQSIGGGGGIVSGLGPFSAVAHAGGNNGIRGFASGVTVTNAGTIATQGLAAMGIVAQSIGAGGGFFVGSASAFAGTTIGGATNKDSGGDAGSVTVSLAGSGSIATQGDGAFGVLAQSIGGGGGFLGDPTQSNWQRSNTSQAGLGTQGSIDAKRSNGNGADVTVSVPAGTSIVTTGRNAHGVFAQSVGGGGGVVSLASSSLVGSNANYKASAEVPSYDGAGGAVTVNVGGTVAATGSGAYGIFAQSSGVSGDKDGVVAVNVTGAVYGNAAGIAAANLGHGSTIAVGSGATLAGGCTAASAGSCASSGYAVLSMTSQSGKLTITNQGTVIGGVGGATVATAGASATTPTPGLAFVNAGTFYAGQEVTNVALEDHGTTYVGVRAGTIAETVLTNSTYRYDGSARLVLDADFLHGQADAIRLVGSSWGALAGTGAPLKATVNTAYLMPARLIVLTQDAASTVDSAAPIAVASSSPVFSYVVTPAAGPQGTTYGLEARARFAPAGLALHDNERAVAAYLQGIWDDGVATPAQKTLANTFARLATVDAAGYEAALSGFVGRMPVVQAAAAPLAAQSFLFNMASCATFADAGVALRERPCVWNRVIGGESRVDTGDPAGYVRRFVSWQGGGQVALGGDWFVGGGIAYTDDRYSDLQPNESASGHGFLAGVSVKRQSGPWVLSATLAGGNAWADASRTFALPGVAGSSPLTYTANASNRTAYVDGKLRATYAIALDGAYLRPALDLDVVYTRMGGYRETGADLYSLDVAAGSQTLFMATPALEAGTRVALDAAGALRVYGMLGLSLLSKDGFSASAALAGVPGGGTFDITAPIPAVFGKAAVGVELFRDGGIEARLQYNADFGSGYVGQAATFRLGYNF